jgi:hypothetical protein
MYGNLENALLLIESVQSALKGGTRHYNKAGKLLETDIEVLECLRDEGEVLLEGA